MFSWGCVEQQQFNIEQKPQTPSNSATKQHSESNSQSEKAHNKLKKLLMKAFTNFLALRQLNIVAKLALHT